LKVHFIEEVCFELIFDLNNEDRVKVKIAVVIWSLNVIPFTNPFRCVAGVFGEHKYIGDRAFLQFFADSNVSKFFEDTVGLGQYVPLGIPDIFCNSMPVGREPVTYGDFTGLSADHSIQPEDVFHQLLLLNSTMSTTLYEHITALKHQKRSATDFELSITDPLYGYHAYIDKSHFYAFGDSSFDELATDFNLNGLLDLNNDFYGNVDKVFCEMRSENAVSKYLSLHALAVEFMFQAGKDFRKFIKNTDDANVLVLCVNKINVAFLVNAFADHFLQDFFSAGHLPVHRSYWTLLDDKGKHDFFCRNGLEVKNLNGESWKTFGDNSYDSTTYVRAIRANVVSLRDLWLTFENARHDSQSVSMLTELQSSYPESKQAKLLLQKFSGVIRQIPIPLSEEDMQQMPFGNSIDGLVISPEPVLGRQKIAMDADVFIPISSPDAMVTSRENDWVAKIGFSYNNLVHYSPWIKAGVLFHDSWSLEMRSLNFSSIWKLSHLNIGLGYLYKPVAWRFGITPQIEVLFDKSNVVKCDLGLAISYF